MKLWPLIIWLALEVIRPIPGFAEPFSSFTHLAAAGVFAVWGVLLLYRSRGKAGRMTAVGVFVFSVVFLLSMSGVYHLLSPTGAGRMVLQRLDHAAIFVLIAGTFTAVHGLLFRGWLRWGVIALLWALVATAIPLKIVFFDQFPEWLSVSLYIGLGWVGLFSGIIMVRRYGWRFIQPVLWGGIAYTLGAVFEFARWPNPIAGVVHAHEIFHLFVIAGVTLHWLFVSRLVASAAATPYPHPAKGQ
jgi:channel protein (hemolysin III family)